MQTGEDSGPTAFCAEGTLRGCTFKYCTNVPGQPTTAAECGTAEHLAQWLDAIRRSQISCLNWQGCEGDAPTPDDIYAMLFGYIHACQLEVPCENAASLFENIAEALWDGCANGNWGSPPAFDAYVYCQYLRSHPEEPCADYCQANMPPGYSPLPIPSPGINPDGSSRLGYRNFLRDPFGDGWSGSAGNYGGVDLASGAIDYEVVDLALPSEGFSWVVGRSHNSRVPDQAGGYADYREDVQGRNWFQTSMPFVHEHTLTVLPAFPSPADRLYYYARADSYVAFVREDADTFLGTGGAGGLAQFDDSSINTWTVYDQSGMRYVFFAENVSLPLTGPPPHTLYTVRGKLWKIIDPAGNIAFVGDASDPADAIENGFNTDGTISVAFDTNGRRYTYSYSTVEGESRLTQVLAEQDVSSVWTEVGKVQYDYYQESDSYGSKGDLRLVTVTMPQSESTPSVRKTYYRYYDQAWANTSGRRGHPHFFQYVVDAEGYRRADWENGTPATTLDDTPLAMSSVDLAKYATSAYEYTDDDPTGDLDRRVSMMWHNGDCGCGSGSLDGETTLTYELNPGLTWYSPLDWSARVMIHQPDGVWVTQYFDAWSQPSSRILTLGDPSGGGGVWSSNFWATTITRDSSGRVSTMYSPAAATQYSHSAKTITLSTTDGLATVYGRFASPQTPSAKVGMIQHVRWRVGGNPSNPTYYSESRDYEFASMTVSGQSIQRPFVKDSYVYPSETTTAFSGASLFVADPEFWTGDAALMPKSITTTNPVVSTTNNGPGGSTGTSSVVYLREDGTVGFTKDEHGILNYSMYEGGLLVKSIEDVNPATSADFASGDGPGHWGLSTSAVTDAYRLITLYSYRREGRVESVTLPNGRILWEHYTTLADGRDATVSVPKVNSATNPTTFYGPASYSVENDAGAIEFSATIDLDAASTSTGIGSWITESTADPIAAVTGPSGVSVTHVSTTQHNPTGSRVLGSRTYFAVPSSLPGTSGTHYDEMTYGYDDMGRQVLATDATGTISRTNFDAIGRYSSREIGTDAGSPGNMERVELVEYDGGSTGGNGYITERALFVDAAETDTRVTQYINDSRGRTIVVVPESGPYAVSMYDNLSRAVASATYSSDSGLTATTDPTSASSNRLSLSEVFFDEMQRGFRTRRWEIDQSDGSKVSGTAYLDSDTWFDAAGRVVKVVGGQLSKTFYDRIGRPTRQFVLATTGDTSYADADDVSGDVVMEEHQTYYNSIGLALMRVNISRFHDDYGGSQTTGALDTDSDLSLVDQSELEGRPQITAMWYDDLDRLKAIGAYGTYGTSDFDRDDSGFDNPPSVSSSTVIVTSRTYRTDGQMGTQVDGLGRVVTTLFDAAGRTIATIENDVASPSQSDHDLITRYEYDDGLQTCMYVDVDRSGTRNSGDQVTLYDYGVPRGTGAGDSQIASNALLWKVQYPDSSGGSDVVTYAYNVLGQQVWTKDQNGSILETAYDALGRIEHRRATTIASGVDGAVERISLTYDSRGRTATVSQWDNATPASGDELDRVTYAYDNWGALDTLEHDLDGYDGGTPADYRYAIGFTHSRVSPASEVGRRTYRRSAIFYPDGTEYNYSYSSASARLDDALSRVTQVGTVVSEAQLPLVEYEYAGLGMVVEKDLLVPAVTSRVFASGHDYARLDRWNRITRNTWERRTAGSTFVPFYDLNVVYDAASNITALDDDYIPGGFDVLVANDALNRASRYEEGTLNGTRDALVSSSMTRDHRLDFDLLANWTRTRRWIESDGSWGHSGSGETTDDARTFNAVNEIATNDFGNNSSNETAPSYDPNGNQIRDGGTAGASVYAYTYDVFNRLVAVRTTDTTPAEVAQYRYNGLGQRIAFRHDEDLDGDVDDEKWSNVVYDERWRMIAVYHEDDKDSGDAPKERFMYHAAGADGRGGSSYIDDTILRDRDHNTAWTSASDGTLERRDFYCQNWRADVVALVDSSAAIQEQVRYGLAGEPFLLSPADVTYSATNPSSGLGVPSGLVNNDDYFHFIDLWTAGTDPRADFNHDGTVNNDDFLLLGNKYSADSAKSWGAATLSNVANRKGYAGYENDRAVEKLWHVRYRVLDGQTGRWLKRDPLRYVDGGSLYSYVMGLPLSRVDPLGLAGHCGCGGGGGGAGLNILRITQLSGQSQPLPTQGPYPRWEYDSLMRQMNRWLPHWWGATGRRQKDAFDDYIISSVVEWVGSEERAWRCFAHWATIQTLLSEWNALYDVQQLANERARTLEAIRSASTGRSLDGRAAGTFGAGVALSQTGDLADAYQRVTTSAYGTRVAKAIGLISEMGGPVVEAGVAVATAWPHFAAGDDYAGSGALLRGLGSAGAGAGLGAMIGGPVGGLVGGVVGLGLGITGDVAADRLANTTYTSAMNHGAGASFFETNSFLSDLMRDKRKSIRESESWFMYYCGNIEERRGFFSPGRPVSPR